MLFRSSLVFAPLVILTLVFGFYPKPILDMSASSVASLLDTYNKAIAVKSAAVVK